MKAKINFKIVLVFCIIILAAASASAKTSYWIGGNYNYSINSDTALFIDTTNSRIGIGTATPDQKLQAVGNVMIGETDTTGGTLYLYGTTAGKYSTMYTSNGNLHIDSGYGAGGDNKIYLNYYNGGTIYFGTGASGAHSSATTAGAWNFDNTLYVSGAGRVGIGDSTPDYILDVEGTGNVASVTSTSGTAVYAYGSTRGAYVVTASTTGIAVLGTGTSGTGIYGYSVSSNGYSGYFSGGRGGIFVDSNKSYNAGNCNRRSSGGTTVSCSGNEEVTGGGCNCDCGDLRTINSYPSGGANNPTQWNCECAGCTPTSWVICCGL